MNGCGWLLHVWILAARMIVWRIRLVRISQCIRNVWIIAELYAISIEVYSLIWYHSDCVQLCVVCVSGWVKQMCVWYVYVIAMHVYTCNHYYGIIKYYDLFIHRFQTLDKNYMHTIKYITWLILHNKIRHGELFFPTMDAWLAQCVWDGVVDGRELNTQQHAHTYTKCARWPKYYIPNTQYDMRTTTNPHPSQMYVKQPQLMTQHTLQYTTQTTFHNIRSPKSQSNTLTHRTTP